MITRDEKKLLIGILVFLVFAFGSMGLVIQSVVDHAPRRDAFALYFWISLGWALFCGAALFIRTRRKDLWTRLVEAEVSWRARRRLKTERMRRQSNSRWIPIIYSVCLVAFVVLTILSARAFFHSND